MKIKMIVNPLSGRKKARMYLPLIKEILGKDNFLHLTITKGKGEPFHEASRVDPSRYDMVVVCGGDGTLNEVINGLLSGNNLIPIGFVPLGTSNIYALSTGIPLNPLHACQIILEQNVSKIDVGRVCDGDKVRYFVSMAGIGYDASVISSLNPHIVKIFGGIPAHLLAGLKQITIYQGHRLTVSVDGRVFSAFQVIVSNGPFYGVSSLLAPGADMTDGFFDVIMFKGGKRLDILRYVLGIVRECHLSFKDVNYVKGKDIEITCPDKVWVQVDGEVMGTTPQRFELLPRILPVILPPFKQNEDNA